MTHINTSRAKLSHVYYTMLLLKSQPKITSSDMGPLFSRQLAKDCVFKDKKYVFLPIDLLSPIFSKLPIGKRLLTVVTPAISTNKRSGVKVILYYVGSLRLPGIRKVKSQKKFF